jgi:AcrR family transcriptional regulator
MGRKSLETQRKEEILVAFERCIVKYGLEVSLEQIADEAGIKRSLIRHYVGNRDALVHEVIERITTDFQHQIERMNDGIPADALMEKTLDFLFRSDARYTDSDQIMLQVLMSAQDRYPLAKQRLQELFSTLINLLANDLSTSFPGRGEDEYPSVAYGILCLSLTNESMMWLGLDATYNAYARQQADRLIAHLQQRTAQ